MSRKCGTVCGGWHHSGGGNSTAVSVLVCDRSPWSEMGGLFRGPKLSLVEPLVPILVWDSLWSQAFYTSSFNCLQLQGRMQDL